MDIKAYRTIGNKNINSVLSGLLETNEEVGAPCWWDEVQTKGTPFILSQDNTSVELLFLWRNTDDSVEEIYIDINGITDHHSFDMERLTHVKGTNVWFYKTSVNSTWRGSYAFIPVIHERVQPAYQGTYQEKRTKHREWLRTIFPLSVRDDLSKNNLSACEWGRSKTPEKLALIDEERSFTYREMRGQVKAIAELLWQHNVSVGDIVAVALPRSTKLSLAFNSIIECGAAYLPLDVGYPDERLAYMVNDAKPKLIITTSEHQARFSAFGELLILDELPKPVASTLTEEKDGLAPYHRAYIIYTSGSTGNQKGVLVSHQAIVNRLKWMQHEYTLNAQDVVLQKTPCSFDVSV